MNNNGKPVKKYGKAEQSKNDRIKYPPTDYLPKEERIITDPLGSWTGTPTDNVLDTPVQDVDDL